MFFLQKIDEWPDVETLLADHNHQQADYYEFSCRSELWGSAFMVALGQDVSAEPNKAIVYLLQGLIMGEGLWDEAMWVDLRADQFWRFVGREGLISNLQGWRIPNAEFLKNYQEITQGIAASPEFKITRNGTRTSDVFRLNQTDIHGAVCFVNEWNNRQYLVETGTHWLYFSWATGV